MIKCTPATEVENKIRKQAAELNLPLTQYLAPFLKAIADGTLTMVVHWPARPVQQKVA
ncbi:MAG: hypothetical protein ACRYG7_13175 [Janthinobacterium lividum]